MDRRLTDGAIIQSKKLRDEGVVASLSLFTFAALSHGYVPLSTP